MSGPVVLLLFDIDGTLVGGATDAHRAALDEALLEVHRIDPHKHAGRGLNPAGRSDGEIVRAILLDAGIAPERIDELAGEVRDCASQAYARLCPLDLTGFVLAGVPALLGELSARAGVKLGLVTGNYESIARLKLARAGLGKHFPSGQGAFGSDSEDRAALPKIARRRAGARGHPYPCERTIVIGDTPLDIACARADGVRCVAVATGQYGAAELTGADAVAIDAAGLRDALVAALGRS
ncbi:MAG: haloacid dehalogenase-like hydrolase [Solirubrobacteraceae bacterium]